MGFARPSPQSEARLLVSFPCIFHRSQDFENHSLNVGLGAVSGAAGGIFTLSSLACK